MRAIIPAVVVVIVAMALALLDAGCSGGSGDDSTPPAKGKANLKVTVVAKPKTGAKPFKSYQPTDAEKAEAAASKGDFELVDYEHLEGIVVWLESAGTDHAHGNVKISVQSRPAKPPMFAASVGDTASFVNGSAKPLKFYSVSEGNEFDLGRLAPGATKDQPLKSPGLIELLDGDTFDVVARVYVAPGWGARIAPVGEATTFRDLDPGEYRVAAWHERMPGDEKSVTLAADRTREVNLLIGVNALPKVE
jgi:hypothetical protein